MRWRWKTWTQKRLAAAFGVAQSAIAQWKLFDDDDVSNNIKTDNTSKPDARVKLDAEAKRLAVAEKPTSPDAA